ncbi:hypothetical protein G7Y89_g9786 [Cudoniella acicularis]|uniref:Uncharacterized protein n=1 Tax=Cudoniella acicularis TaxID=354080 RepID=A0A8H4RGP5_9HELO|nr:hypothetical protein G7Y89_g9786 [Cudoniella acicularis]
MGILLVLSLLSLVTHAFGQLIGPVGVTTPLCEKTHECNIFDFGGVADNSTDVSLAITSAFENCVQKHPKSRLIVPAGNYLLKTSIVLSNGSNWAFQLDGLITAEYTGNSTFENFLVPRELILQGFAGVQDLNSTINGEGDGNFLENLIVIINAVDFEFYSENGLGAIQGQGYLYRISGNPKFHFVFDFGVNIEVYHLTIRGANLGSYDGIDAIGTNYHIHDNEVTNRDECVSVKSPSNHALVENLVCNRVGSGISIGSLNVSAEISNIHARNISVLAANEIAFIKTYPGGSGYVTNVTWENFRSKANLYGLNVDQYWQETFTPDTGAVALSNIIFRNFTGNPLPFSKQKDNADNKGGIANGALRPPLYLIASDFIPAENITVEDFSLWTESGDHVVNQISNVYGSGDDVYGPNDGIQVLEAGATPTAYTTSYTITTPPSGWTEPPSPAWAAPSTGYGTTDPIPVYTPAPLWKPQGEYDKHYWGSF